jgi:hypothetical protein
MAVCRYNRVTDRVYPGTNFFLGRLYELDNVVNKIQMRRSGCITFRNCSDAKKPIRPASRRPSQCRNPRCDDAKIALIASYSAAKAALASGRGDRVKEKCVLVDSLKKQEGRDAQGRFEKGRSGNPEGRFRKGQSGNPQGRPPGVRNKATEAAELLLDGEAEALTRKAMELALEGDAAALRLCLERIIPRRRGRTVQLGLPPVRGAADLGNTMAAITTAATSGAITPGEAAELARVVEIFVRAVETSDFERRLQQLEERNAASA